jgi:hypothetical protein
MATKLDLHHIKVCSEQSGVQVTRGVLELRERLARFDRKQGSESLCSPEVLNGI